MPEAIVGERADTIVTRAAEIRASQRLPWEEISAELGVSQEWLRSKMIARGLRPAARKGDPTARGGNRIIVDQGPGVDEMARYLMTLIPPDTRSLTGKILGDPLPGRSALDMERARA